MNFWEFGLIFVCFALILGYMRLGERGPRPSFRRIKAFQEMHKQIEQSVEDGTRLHISLGRGGLLGPQSAAAFAGLSILREAARIASDSDKPPIATAGEGILTLLAQDTLRNSFKAANISENYHHRLAQLRGLSPLAYAAGTLPLMVDGEVAASALVGSFGEEIALLTTPASQEHSSFTLAGSDSLSSQAILFASAEESLIGEEVYAAGAYLGEGQAEQASLRAQDMLRIVFVVLILILSLFNLVSAVL